MSTAVARVEFGVSGLRLVNAARPQRHLDPERSWWCVNRRRRTKRGYNLEGQAPRLARMPWWYWRITTERHANGVNFWPETDLGTCPYLWGEGVCSFGCREEPACIAEHPSEGWPSERRRNLRTAARSGRTQDGAA